MKILVVLTTLAFLMGCVTAKPPSLPRGLKLMPHVAQAMIEIQREYEVETARCLTGFVEDGTVFVESMEPTWILFQNNNSVQFQNCTGSDVVGWFHNHPPDIIDEELVTYCSILSQGDIETLDYGRNFWIAIITCDENTIVYRFKLDGRNYVVEVPFLE